MSLKIVDGQRTSETLPILIPDIELEDSRSFENEHIQIEGETNGQKTCETLPILAPDIGSVDPKSFKTENAQIEGNTIPENQAPREQGLPVRKRRITRQDALALSIMVVCCTLSLISILNSRVAFKLGQNYQLVVIGFFLSVMSFFFQGRFRDLLINLEASHFGSRLQDYDAVLRNDFMANHASLLIRALLAMSLLLPLGLSAAYKVFTGGSTIFNTDLNQSLQFGLVGAPGAQQLGDGISLMVNSTLPFFVKPLASYAYGYNMNVGSHATAMFLDAPMPDTVARLRQSLRDDEILEISAQVNGSLSSYLPISGALVGSLELASSALDWDATQAVSVQIPLYPGYFALLHDSVNYTNICVAAYGGINIFTSGNFSNKIKCVHTQRTSCTGYWQISRSSAVLLDAECVNNSSLNQSIIANNFMQLNTFADLLAECITHPTEYYLYNNDSVDLTVPAVAAALWSRIVSLSGDADGPGVGGAKIPYEGTHYNVVPTETRLRYPTLRRNWVLLLIVLLYPVLTLLIVLVRATWYFSTPVDQGFGIVALLAGASLSGQTKSPVPMKIRVESGFADTNGSSMGRIRYLVGEIGKADRIKRGGEKFE